ncbi:MAG: hypothetical protein HQL67_12140 [Magnetococcales bacterium]|nr:hypothetical protein [Magnetococcales bacterium]
MKKISALIFKNKMATSILLIGGVAAYLLSTGQNSFFSTEQADNPVKISPPVIKGLFIGMTLDQAEREIKKNLADFLFEGDEFMYHPFEPGSNADLDAQILRNQIRFIKNEQGSFDFGGTFSFGYDSDSLRSSYIPVSKIIDPQTTLHSEQQSFGSGLVLKADSNRIVHHILFKPHFVKRVFALNNQSNEDFTRRFVADHQLHRLGKTIQGGFTGDLSEVYEQTGKNGFRVIIDEDLEIQMDRTPPLHP